MAVVDPPMVDVLPDKPRTRGIARTKAGKARTATRSVAARSAGMHFTHEPDKNWAQPESRTVLSINRNSNTKVNRSLIFKLSFDCRKSFGSTAHQNNRNEGKTTYKIRCLIPLSEVSDIEYSFPRIKNSGSGCIQKVEHRRKTNHCYTKRSKPYEYTR